MHFIGSSLAHKRLFVFNLICLLYIISVIGIYKILIHVNKTRTQISFTQIVLLLISRLFYKKSQLKNYDEQHL